MKIALITTTINIPTVLQLYRAYDPDVRFFVALDKNTSEEACNFIAYDLENTHSIYYSIYLRQQAHWKCSELIGFNCIQRRNIALLEALKWGADIIISIDDDNIPLSDYTAFVYPLASLRWDGIQAIPASNWLNIGGFTHPYFLQRGIPKYEGYGEFAHIAPITNAKVGVAQGICFGDPDCSAQSRISGQPRVRQPNIELSSGLLFKPTQNRWTVFNTQSTAMIRQLAPAWFCPPALGRFDDIVASLICQRIMRETGHVIRFGPPFFYQQRNPHDLQKDLAEERWGTENIERVVQELEGLSCLYECESVYSMCLHIWRALEDCPWFPQRAVQAALAFLEDVEPLL
jgi:hypothetical protein